MSAEVLQRPQDVSAFVEDRFNKYWRESSNYSQAQEWAFHDLNNAKGGTKEIETLRHRRLVDIAFAMSGETGAQMLRRIPDTSETQAFETTYGNGITLYHMAVSQGDSHMLDAMVDRITKVGDVSEDMINCQDKDGFTPLHVLVQHSAMVGLGVKMSLHERQEALRSLIVDAKADTTLKDNHGRTASDYLDSLIDRTRGLMRLPAEEREVWESDQFLGGIVDDAASMRQALTQIKVKGELNYTHVREGRVDEGHNADVIDMQAFREKRSKDEGPDL